MKILEAVNVKYVYKNKYQTVTALNGVTCSFEQGKFYTIEGRSGCGKSTFLSLLAGLDTPSEGILLFNGNPYSKLDMNKFRREKIAIIFQAYNLFPRLNVKENVMYPAHLLKMTSKKSSEKAMHLLDSVGLNQNYFKRYPDMLSGGEQQRVAIARALMSNGKVLLADEPTGNLDRENGKTIINILKDIIKKYNSTIILVTHDHSISEQADVTYYMEDGKIL